MVRGLPFPAVLPDTKMTRAEAQRAIDDIRAEAADEVLHRAKFSFSEERIRRILIMIQQFGLPVNPSPTGEILVDMMILFSMKLSWKSGWKMSIWVLETFVVFQNVISLLHHLR